VHRPKDEPRRLRRACALAAVAHVVAILVGHWAVGDRFDEDRGEDITDIELAPEAPEAQALPAEQEAAPLPPSVAEPEADEAEAALPPDEAGDVAIDAGLPDAARVARADAGVTDAAAVAASDGGAGDAAAVAASDGGAGDGGAQVAALGGGGAPGDGGAQVAIAGDGGAPGDATRVAAAAPIAGDGGAPAGEAHADQAGAGAATVPPGTAANLLSYFPSGHVVTLLVRFDRLRGTEWARATEALLAPMPDYQTLIGDRPVHIVDVFDTLVISTPSPKDVAATTLVGRSAMPPPDLRALLDQPGARVAWGAARGGALGRRRPGSRVFPGDHRVFLMPFTGWIVLTQPADLGALTRRGGHGLDHDAADADVPEWLRRVRTIETESGKDAGPALVLTMAALAGRYQLPDIGVGVTSVPAPERVTLALTIDKHGFVVRGNLRFRSVAAAKELVRSATTIHDRVMDSHVLQLVLRKSRVLNVIKGMSLVRTGRRVAYATSISIADARDLLAVAAQTVGDYYAAQRLAGPGAPAP
jgi:hypothetical protein